MLTFAIGLLILSFAFIVLGIMLDEVFDWGKYVVVSGASMACLALVCLAGCVFYYGVHA